ncbi:MAG TPA: MCE family protein [Streptosporangiaceae bacterium]|nr:MCE family protein [Streptosporangiaceae bacterium]
MTPSGTKARRRLGGVAFLLVLALLVWLSVAVYQKKFASVAMVTLYTSSAGNEMHPGAQVMVRGVQVGEVRQITAEGTGARLELAIEPSQLPMLPANVSAQMLPTTLFGERYVDLILPQAPTAARLTSGSVIQQDRSADAIELDQVLGNLLPMLAATQPDKLSMALTAIAQGLQGQGHELGQALVTLNSYLEKLNPQLPQIDTDITKLAALARTYNKAAPDIVQALNDFGVTGRTLANQHVNFDALLANLTTSSDDLTAFLNANSANAIMLSADSLSTLHILARYAPEFPCVLQQLTDFVPAMNKALGAGTNEAGLHVHVVIEPASSTGAYLPRVDAPVYGDNLGPRCYSVPFTGVHLSDGVRQSSAGKSGTGKSSTGKVRKAAADTASLTGTGPAGLAGSPGEAALVRELDALALGRPTASIPAWASLLTAPLYRGATVRVG